MSKIAVRAYTQKPNQTLKKHPYTFKDPPLYHKRVLVFDTETTTDEYQNLTFGSFKIYQDGFLQHEGIFYNPLTVTVKNNVKTLQNIALSLCVGACACNINKDVKTLQNVASKRKIPLYTVNDFIDQVFYPEVYRLRTLCVGFNLPFDISRLALKASNARKNYRQGFTLCLSQNVQNPPIIVKKIGTFCTFHFSTTVQNRHNDYFEGHFLDTQTLAEVLLQEKHLSLEKAGHSVNLPVQKKKVSEHGKITQSYIDYNIRDVETTYELYKRLVVELQLYDIAIPITKVHSSASLGKHALKQLGIRPLTECQPDFPPSLLGNIMTAYYGGRTECKIRKTPTKVSVLDFTSMYPTITMLLGLWDFIIAQGIETENVTREIQELVDKTEVVSVHAQGTDWKRYVVLVQVQPDNDILPVRMDYKGDKTSFNVGINYLTSKEPLWYALPDVIASKLLTGKSPKIIQAIRFLPKGKQRDLKSSQILGIPVDRTKDNLLQVLVERRQQIKNQLKTLSPEDPTYAILSSREKAMKILVNAMSYGIFIELNPEDKKSEVQVFGVDVFTTKKNHYERPGTFFHPLLAVIITAGARLLLAIAEAKLLENGACHAYMDTDSIFVPPDHTQNVIDFFRPLNPYSVSIPLLKVERENIWFYGISSKRYALYTFDKGNITFPEGERSFKLHGLGHLSNPFPNSQNNWQAEIWQDILSLHYGVIFPHDIEERYSRLYGITKLTATTTNILNRFKSLNEDKDWLNQIKPFNFVLVGFQVIKKGRKPIKPLTPHSKDPQSIVHIPFIDYESGEVMQGLQYFKPLSKTILQYIDHPEYKYEGDIGNLERRGIVVTDVIHIGKEANNIDDEPLDGGIVQVFTNLKKERHRIISMRQCDAEREGIDRKTRWKLMNKYII